MAAARPSVEVGFVTNATMDTGRRVVRKPRRIPGRIHRQVILYVFDIQICKVKLLHEPNQLLALEVAERITAQA